MKIYKEKINNISSFLELNNEDKKNLFCSNTYINDFVKKDEIIYHKKQTTLKRTVNELIGEMISDYFNLNTVHSFLCRDYNNYLYLLNELFTNKNNKYGYLNKNLFPNFLITKNLENLNSLNLIYDKEYNKKYTITNESFSKLKNNLKKLIIRDFITLTSDRWEKNIMFDYDKNIVRLMPVFDYEFSFKEGSLDPYNNVFKIRLNDKKTIDFIRNDDTIQENLEKAMLLNMKYIFTRLKEEHNINLSITEKWDYKNIIRERKKDIMSYKLIK